MVYYRIYLISITNYSNHQKLVKHSLVLMNYVLWCLPNEIIGIFLQKNNLPFPQKRKAKCKLSGYKFFSRTSMIMNYVLYSKVLLFTNVPLIESVVVVYQCNINWRSRSRSRSKRSRSKDWDSWGRRDV